MLVEQRLIALDRLRVRAEAHIPGDGGVVLCALVGCFGPHPALTTAIASAAMARVLGSAFRDMQVRRAAAKWGGAGLY